MQKRVIAVHDISCVGKCSLTVALPIISAAGVECSVLPTAVLSTHTGGFAGYTFRDLTEDIRPIIDHWKSLGLKADCIYTGYLGSFEQLDLVGSLFSELGGEALKIVDPVMADNGELYPAFSMEYAKGMAGLCQKADLIIPNLTEASFILGEPYLGSSYTEADISSLLKKLSSLGPKKVVLTGVSFSPGKLGAASYNDGNIEYYSLDLVEGYYHGTGDIFGSALCASLVNGISLEDAVEITVDFTVEAIKRTHSQGTDPKYGVDFENCLSGFISAIERKR